MLNSISESGMQCNRNWVKGAHSLKSGEIISDFIFGSLHLSSPILVMNSMPLSSSRFISNVVYSFDIR